MTEEAFSDFYRAYKHRLVRLAYGRLHDSHLAEDIAQETLFRAHRLLPADMRENPWPWLKTVAINACEDLRESRREVLGKATEELAGRETADSATNQREAVDAVRRAIEALTPIQRETIRLAHFEEKSYAEIASLQGIRVEDVRDRLNYTRGKLKTKLRQFADYPLRALIPVFKVRVWRMRAVRLVTKAAAVAAVSVTGIAILGPRDPVPSQAAQSIVPSQESAALDNPAEPAMIPKETDGGGSAASVTAGSQGATKIELTKPVNIPSAPSPEGPGSSGGTIGPTGLRIDCEAAEPGDQLAQAVCAVWNQRP